MRKTSEFTDVVLSIAKEAEGLRKAASRARPIPLMQEKLSRRDAVARVRSMTPQNLSSMAPKEREALLKEVGTDAVLDIIRQGQEE